MCITRCLVRAVPVFVKEGDSYRWSHKSLAEYFAAQYICVEGKSQQAQILGAFLSTGRTLRFSNVPDQIYDIDSTAFRAHLTLPMARAFQEYWETSYKRIDVSVSAQDVTRRKEIMFDQNMILMPFELARKGLDEKELEEIVGKAMGRPFSLDESTFMMYMFDPGQVLAIVGGPFSVVIDILAGKKDPLVQTFARETQTGQRYKLPTQKEPHLISDSPDVEYNKSAFFSRFTMALVRYPNTHILNSARVLGFEKSFEDTDRLAQLADELIQPMLQVDISRAKLK